MMTLAREGAGDVKPDYTALLAKAADFVALIGNSYADTANTPRFPAARSTLMLRCRQHCPALPPATSRCSRSAIVLPTSSRWSPASVSVDQYAATLAGWFGVGTGQMSTVLPNIGNYNPSSLTFGLL